MAGKALMTESDGNMLSKLEFSAPTGVFAGDAFALVQKYAKRKQD